MRFASSLRRRVRDVSRNTGLGEVVRLAPRWLVRREFVVWGVDLPSLQVEPPPSGELDRSELTPDQAPLVAGLNPLLGVEEIRRRLGEGERCDLTWCDGRVVNYRWSCTGRVYLPYLRKELKLADGDVLVSGVYTDPSFRGRGLCRENAIAGVLRAKERGLRRHLAIIASWNVPPTSIWIHDLLATRLGAVGYWNLGLTRKYFADGRVGFDRDGRAIVR